MCVYVNGMSYVWLIMKYSVCVYDNGILIVNDNEIVYVWMAMECSAYMYDNGIWCK